ncbi:IPT/TIG domain-containing protein [Spirosoma sp.]|uniref:IPT/TIG domain-containing protein n=1 Tax=Spirosoma sp. TaxID=1899569 RepID=UPI003B3A358E
MQITKRFQYLLLVATGLTVAISACKNEDTPAPDPLSITSISPTQAPVGASIVITGTSFNATPASNTVVFGGNATAQVTGASTTSLTVVVPANAQNGAISLTSGGTTVQSPSSANFTISNREVITLANSITANQTLTADKIYALKGYVYVSNNAVLTIQPGTVIRGYNQSQDPENQNHAGTLIIERGSRLEAKGTAQAPIIFTSSQAAGSRKYGDWGGVVLIGRAPTNQGTSRAFEGGIRGTFDSNLNVADDNSGTLQYVRIEFPGVALSATPNSEINGLTFYQVGSGTTIDHVQVSYSGDDAFEWFGGTVNAKYLVAHRTFDDDFDTDYGYSGKVQFGVALRDPNVADQSGSEAFESDNFDPGVPVTAGLPYTAPVFANFSAFAFNPGVPSSANTAGGSGAYRAAMHVRRNTKISIYNSVFTGFPEGLRLEGTADGTLANINNGSIELQGIVFGNSEIPNSTTVVRGIGDVTTAAAQAYFNTASRKNQIIGTDITSLLLNAQNFSLTAPNFLPQATSPLLVATNAATGGKIADSFFTAAPYRGAFNTENWTAGWTNFDPQNANYDR